VTRSKVRTAAALFLAAALIVPAVSSAQAPTPASPASTAPASPAPTSAAAASPSPASHMAERMRNRAMTLEAMRSLARARGILRSGAEGDPRGHRANAINHIDAAMSELKAAMRSDTH
jgi:hypothetical protein